jgi:hypothetical protein
MVRLNLGCGRDYRTGWLNVDFNAGIKLDLRADLFRGVPLADNSVEEVLLDNVIEHISRERIFAFLEDLHRVCRRDAMIRIYTPHFSGMFAHKHLTHYTMFGIGTFDIFAPEAPFNAERYSPARFKVETEELFFFHHNLINYPLLSRLPINWLFNFGMAWKLMMERFQFLGFDEIYYELRVVK